MIALRVFGSEWRRFALWLLLVPLACGCASSSGHLARIAPSEKADGETLDAAGFVDTTGDGLPDTRLASEPARGRPESFRATSTVEPTEGQAGGRTVARKLTYAAELALMVTSIADAKAALTEATSAAGGYLSQQVDQTFTLRVPAAGFPAFLAKVRTLGRVLSESMRADDVTDRHFDLSLRLENAEASRKRLLALLEKAEEMKDILQIEESLRRLTTEIESLKGQLKLLDDRIAMSVVTVELRANAPQVNPGSRRKRSRFLWIRGLGIEQDRRRF